MGAVWMALPPLCRGVLEREVQWDQGSCCGVRLNIPHFCPSPSNMGSKYLCKGCCFLLVPLPSPVWLAVCSCATQPTRRAHTLKSLSD